VPHTTFTRDRRQEEGMQKMYREKYIVYNFIYKIYQRALKYITAALVFITCPGETHSQRYNHKIRADTNKTPKPEKPQGVPTDCNINFNNCFICHVNLHN
jgi:hypothetical protein